MNQSFQTKVAFRIFASILVKVLKLDKSDTDLEKTKYLSIQRNSVNEFTK